MTRKRKEHNYTASSLKAVTKREHLIIRMSQTFGPETGDEDNQFSSQKSVSYREILDNAVDEVLAGYGDRVRVHFYKDGSFEVTDNGRGIPIDTGKDSEGRPCSGIYLAMGIIQSGAKYAEQDFFSSGTNGVGASSTAALSKRFDVEVYRNNKIHRLSFKDGNPGFFAKEGDPDAKFTPIKDLTKLQVTKDNRPAADKKLFKTGTRIRVWLDHSIFMSKYPVDVDDLIERMRGTALLIPKITFEIENEHRVFENGENQKEVYHFEGGIQELIELAREKDPIGKVIYVEGEATYTDINVPIQQEDGSIKNMDVDRKSPIQIALLWENDFNLKIESYVNTIRTKLGGIHEAALQKAIVKSFNKRFRSMRGVLTARDPDPIWEDYEEGLIACLAVYVHQPQFTNQIKERLDGRALHRALTTEIERILSEWLNTGKNYDAVKAIGEKVALASKNRTKAREQREINRQKNALTRTRSMPAKLLDCEITHDPMSELIICEGDSASGAVKSSRSAKTQAVLAIRGKIINAKKSDMKAVLANREVQDIIQCLDCGIGAECNSDNARYQMVTIACDNDVDGNAIATLIYALFSELFPDFIKKGRLYKIETPLFLNKLKGGEMVYTFDEQEQREFLEENKPVKIGRAKGLGELNANVLSEFGLDHDTRYLTRIVMNSKEEEKKMLETTLGGDVETRREWIKDNPIGFIEE